MPALIAVTSELMSVTPARLTETATRLVPEVEEKPGPVKLNVVKPVCVWVP